MFRVSIDYLLHNTKVFSEHAPARVFLIFSLMITNVVILIVSQVLFSIADLLARSNLSKTGLSAQALLSWWFLCYMFLRTLCMFGELYVFSRVDLGKTTALFGAASIVIANSLGMLLLGEFLSPIGYIATMLAVTAFVLLLIG